MSEQMRVIESTFEAHTGRQELWVPADAELLAVYWSDRKPAARWLTALRPPMVQYWIHVTKLHELLPPDFRYEFYLGPIQQGSSAVFDIFLLTTGGQPELTSGAVCTADPVSRADMTHALCSYPGCSHPGVFLEGLVAVCDGHAKLPF